MVKKYDKELIKKGIIKFDTKLHTFDTEKSHATLSPPMPALKELGINNKGVELTVTIQKKDVNGDRD